MYLSFMVELCSFRCAKPIKTNRFERKWTFYVSVMRYHLCSFYEGFKAQCGSYCCTNIFNDTPGHFSCGSISPFQVRSIVTKITYRYLIFARFFEHGIYFYYICISIT